MVNFLRVVSCPLCARVTCGVPAALSIKLYSSICLPLHNKEIYVCIMPSRRFDFNLNRPMSPAEVAEVERLVNSWVAAASPTAVSEMDLDAARAAGATAMFGEKYDDVVRVVEVPGVSMELCGGKRQLTLRWGATVCNTMLV